jgi:hypothetical protein
MSHKNNQISNLEYEIMNRQSIIQDLNNKVLILGHFNKKDSVVETEKESVDR